MRRKVDVTKLRRQLYDMRDALLEKLARRVTGDDLALIGTVGAAIAALQDYDALSQPEVPQQVAAPRPLPLSLEDFMASRRYGRFAV